MLGFIPSLMPNPIEEKSLLKSSASPRTILDIFVKTVSESFIPSWYTFILSKSLAILDVTVSTIVFQPLMNGINSFLMLLITGIIETKILLNDSIFFDSNFSPIRPRAARTLLNEPEYVSLAFVACSPKASFITLKNDFASTFPLEIILLISSSVTPYASANLPVTRRPRSDSCWIRIVCTLPVPAIAVKILAISVKSVLVIAATPEMLRSTVFISSPALIPEAPN